MDNTLYNLWEEAITDLIIDQLEISRGDAQGIVEAHSIHVDQSWNDRLSPRVTLDIILNSNNV